MTRPVAIAFLILGALPGVLLVLVWSNLLPVHAQHVLLAIAMLSIGLLMFGYVIHALALGRFPARRYPLAWEDSPFSFVLRGAFFVMLGIALVTVAVSLLVYA